MKINLLELMVNDRVDYFLRNNQPNIYKPKPKKRKCFSKHKRARVWKLSDKHCYYCKKLLINYLQETIDHLTPLSRGGSNDLDNLVFCCKACNAEKKDMTEIEYINYKLKK